MLDTFEDVTQWAAGSGVANLAADTSNQNQGAGCLEYDKTGTSSVDAIITRDLAAPWDLQAFIGKGYSLALDAYHADFTNFDSIRVRLVYAYDTSGAVDVYDEWYLDSLTGAQWNTLQVSVDSPNGTPGGTPSVAYRRRVVAYQVVARMDDVAHTFADLHVDALRLTGKQYACLLWDGNRVPMVGLHPWTPAPQEERHINRTPLGVDLWQLARKEGIRFGCPQVRHVHDADSDLHTLEDALRLFDQYSLAGKGWGVAYPANELIATTLASAASKGAKSISVASAVDVAFIGSGMDLRLGPGDTRQVGRVRALDESGTTVRLAQPLDQDYEAGTPVRSLGYWPTLYRDGGMALSGSGGPVGLSVLGVETL